MCLWINKTAHTETMRYRNQDIPKPLIADKDIPCTKYLDVLVTDVVDGDVCSCSFFTPFFGKQVKFDGRGVAKLVSDVKSAKNFPFTISKDTINPDNPSFYIERGIHSCQETCNGRGRFLEIHAPFKAVIPKGAMYYVGEWEDFVSNELIIFEHLSAFQCYIDKNMVWPIQ